MQNLPTVGVFDGIADRDEVPQQLVHAKVAIQVVSNGKVTTARSKDKLAEGDKLRLYIEPQEEMFLYVVHTDQNATGLLAKTNTSATAASELVVLPSESEYYEIDGNSSFEQITIICAKKRQPKIEALFSENAPSLAAWQETELALLQQYQIDLNESTDKPFGIAGNVRNLGENAAGDAQRSRAQRFTDGEADEARTRVVAGDEEQDAEHEEQLDRDEHHADAHARLERDGVGGERLALERRERRARVRERVHADAEPRDEAAARDADEAEREDDEDLRGLALGEVVLREAEVVEDHGSDEELEDHDELDLRDEVRLAGLVDELADLEHRLVDRHGLQLREDPEAEAHAR